ncbi:uncharacterized protein LOC129593123 [Paramacrobiotus metropolitanus]|uniref:uncharacterized protein LOC129593123 n=1 Tax=Paramacrobiotus metropolitanus TaxID=2943436 RepID=UPI00244657F8|nr:uncharacterized protein LOC129593123 [Paramacrobiotus metropolitanus]
MEVFSKDIIDYLRNLHCGDEYEWYRHWWSSNGLLQSAGRKQIFSIPIMSWHNDDLAKRDVFLPIDCAVVPFANGSGSIDFAQYTFSINEDTYLREVPKTHPDSMVQDTFPALSTDGPTQTECDLSFLNLRCPSLQSINSVNCEHPDFSDQALYAPSCLGDLRRLSGMLAQLPPRALIMTWMDNITIGISDMGYVRPYVVAFFIKWVCSKPRTANLLYQLRLVNLLDYGLFDNTNLDIKKSIFTIRQN